KSYKRECQEKNLPVGSMPILFYPGIQPNCLNMHSRSESGLPQAQSHGSSPRTKRRETFLFPVVPFHFRDGAIHFLKQQA
ncbi:MAG: hypothetical protein WA491_00005, partial [Candidatus Acidiferrum sp.]